MDHNFSSQITCQKEKKNNKSKQETQKQKIPNLNLEITNKTNRS